MGTPRRMCQLRLVKSFEIKQAQICAEGCEEEYITHIFLI